MSNVRKAKHGWILTLVFTLISIAYIMPIVIVLMNSLKRKIFISNRPFALPDAKSFVGIENYINGIQKTDFFRAFGYTLFITVGSVYPFQNCRYAASWKPCGNHYRISWIWSRACGIYVLWICKIHSA